jgi:hypothetical protein
MAYLSTRHGSGVTPHGHFLSPTQAIVAAALIIGASVIVSRVVAPFDFAVGMNDSGDAVLWRVNTITGDTEVCRTLGNLNRVKRSEIFELSHASPCP